MIGNQIRSIETRATDGPAGAVIFVGLDIFDVSSADAFVADVVQKVVMQRMVSPPDTRMLCITLMGPLSSRTFATLWHKHAQVDPAATSFMCMLSDADVIHGTPQGQVLDQTSLLAPPPAARPGQGAAAQTADGGLWSRARSLFGGKRS